MTLLCGKDPYFLRCNWYYVSVFDLSIRLRGASYRIRGATYRPKSGASLSLYAFACRLIPVTIETVVSISERARSLIIFRAK